MLMNQILPIVYLRNSTKENIENIYFSFDNIELMGSKVKRVKSDKTKNISLYLSDRQKFQLKSENYDLIMHHGNNNQYVVCECYGASPISRILVEIMCVYNDGTLGLKIEENYSPI